MITDYFASLSEVLQADFAAAGKTPRHGALAAIVNDRLLRPFLPLSVRLGTGMVIDRRERQAGPFDCIASGEFWPSFGHGEASVFLIDGTFFCLSARDWSTSDLTQFAQNAQQMQNFERQQQRFIPCAAFSFGPLMLNEVLDFMKSPAGASVDAVLSLGNNLVIRNRAGWYGDMQKVPFVTENLGAPALKGFAFFLLQCVQSALGQPFAMGDYQHL